MKIVPKTDANWQCDNTAILSEIQRSGAFEIQLLGGDLTTAYESAADLVRKLCGKVKLHSVILHMPNTYNIIELAANNPGLRQKTEKMFVKSGELANELGIKVFVLFHVLDNFNHFIDFGAMEFINNLLSLKTSTEIILENSIRDIRMNVDTATTLEKLFQYVDQEKLHFCLDLCHLQASENAFQRRFTLSKSQLKKLMSVHFSYTAEHDGYRDKKRTHGRVHPNVQTVIKDLDHLKSLGVDIEQVWMVLEITEDDYSNRPDLVREIQLLTEAAQYQKSSSEGKVCTSTP